MQLRIPKRYQPNARRRRSLFRRRFTWLFLFTALGATLAYFMLQNPDPFRAGASNLAANMEDEIDGARDRMFPIQPTATPDVRGDIVECENAYALGDLNTVIEACERALVGRPNDVNLHYREAYTLVVTSSFGLDADRIAEALEMADRTILSNPESALGWTIKAMALDWSREHAMALPYALRALELDPNLIIAKAHLANIYRNLARPELARPLIEEALNDIRNPQPNQVIDNETRAQVYRNYGRFLASVDANFEDALTFMQLARDAMPSHTYIAIEMADLYVGLNQFDQQIALLENALDINPLDIALLSRLGDAYYNQAETGQATEMYTRCLNRDPEFIDCLSPLGRIQYLTFDNYQDSLRYLERATENGSANPYDWYLLGRSHWKLQQCQFAGEPLQIGYDLLVEQQENPFVAIDDFLRAFRECGLPPPVT